MYLKRSNYSIIAKVNEHRVEVVKQSQIEKMREDYNSDFEGYGDRGIRNFTLQV